MAFLLGLAVDRYHPETISGGARMKRTVRQAAGQGGFTLVEIISVLLIIGIIASVVITRIASTVDYSLQSQTEQLKTHIRYSQSMSMGSSTVFGVYFPNNTSYSIYYGGSTSNLTKFPGASDYTVNLPPGMTLLSYGTSTVSFDTWGKPYTDAANQISQSGTRTITLAMSGKTRSLNITQNTGFIP